MALYKLTVNQNIYCSGGVIPKGASVEVPVAPGRSFDFDDAKRVCQNGAPSFYNVLKNIKQSLDFPKPGLCHVRKFL